MKVKDIFNIDTAIGFTMIFATLAAVVVLIVVLTNSVGGPAPADWNPNSACRIHHGVQQVSSSDGYVVAVVCKDGVFISNPYD